jgi:formate dehydrogenase subunit beta
MTTSWMIETHGDPLGTVRDFIGKIWETAELETLLAPLNGKAESTGPEILSDRADLSTINPFTPLMPVNAAGMVPELVHNGQKSAAMLRPCEMRTLIAMIKNDGLPADSLLTICVDCLGTLPADEFAWRAQRKGSPKGLASEALQFAQQGGIVPYRYRAACQICISPEASEADVNIGVLGLPVRQYLTVSTPNSDLAARLRGENPPLAEHTLDQHQRVVARLSERGRSTRARIFTGLGGLLPTNIDTLLEPLKSCDNCRACLDACPLSTSDYPHRDENGRYDREEAMEWLVNCSGCGMCEQACPQHLPLTIIFGHIQEQLAVVAG